MNLIKENPLDRQLRDANILVIDDFQGMRTMLRNIIKDIGGIKIDTAANGRDAIGQLRATRYDIVICDYNLGPGPNGQHVLEEAKLNQFIGPSTVWVMVTAEKTSDMVMGAAEIKPDDYILKPINHDTLESRLEKLIVRKRALSAIESAVRARDLPAAIAACDQRIQERPPNLQEILRIKADLLLDSGRLDEAAQVFGAVLAQRSVPWAKTGLAKVHFQRKEYDTAIALLEEVLADNRIYMEAYDWLAKVLEAKGDVAQSLQVLQNATQLSPNAAARQKNLGDVAYKSGDLDLAQKAFEKNVKITEFSPTKSAAVYANLAKVYAGKKMDTDALGLLARSKREFRDDPLARLETSIAESMVYRGMGQESKAMEALEQAQKLNQELGGKVQPALCMEMAQAMLQLGQTEGATALLRTLVRNQHDNPALAARVQQVFESASLGEQGRALIEHSRQEVIDINNRGVALGREGRFEEAIALLRQARQELPDNETVLMNLCGLLIVQMKRSGPQEPLEKEIRELLRHAQDINPGNRKLQEYSAALAR